MIVAGVDPGLTGAFAFLDTTTSQVAAAFPMPVLSLSKGKGTKREISFPMLVQTIDDTLGINSLGYVFVEAVTSSPQQGVTSAFNFGVGYGGLKGIIAARRWPVEYVTPAKWKRTLSVPADKEAAIQRACNIMPAGVHFWTPRRGHLTKDQACGVAEAALVGFFGIQWLQEHRLLSVQADDVKPNPIPRVRVLAT